MGSLTSGIGSVQVDIGRNHSVLQGQDGLDDACKSCSALGVAHVWFHLATQDVNVSDGKGPSSAICTLECTYSSYQHAAMGTPDARHRTGFQRVPRGRSSAVAFEKRRLGEVALGDAGLFVHPSNQLLLQHIVRRHDALRPPVVVGPTASNHGPDRIAIAQRMPKSLDIDGVDSLGSSVAVGQRIKRLALAAGREHARLGEDDARLHRRDDVAPQRHGRATGPVAHRLGGQMQRHHRRRTARLDQHRRARPAVLVRDAVGLEKVEIAGAAVQAACLRIQRLLVLPVRRERAHVAADVAAGSGLAGRVETFARDLEELALHGVHAICLELAAGEEGCVVAVETDAFVQHVAVAILDRAP